MNTENGIASYISAKTIILIIVAIIILYTGASFISSSSSSSSSSGTISNKIICKQGQAIQNGACIDVSPCGLLPITGLACSTGVMICDQDLGNIWRCPLPCESTTNIIPQFGIGSCGKQEVKCDSSGRYYCENDKQVCNGRGSFYGEGYNCVCDTDCYGVNCENKCPSGTFLYNNTCKLILPCLNGTFSKETNQCICNNGYYNKNDMCLLIPNCNKGTFNRQSELCNCESGYFGKDCDMQCASGQYLYNGNCTNMLTCNNGGTFNPSSHTCTCMGSWKGLTCEYSASLNCNNNGSVVLDANGFFLNCSCYPGSYGPSCADTRSKCGGHGTPQYDSKGVFTGCLCDPGFSGNTCQLSGAIYCNNHGTPNVKPDGQTFSGTCSCQAGYDQPFCCDHASKPFVTPCIENPPVCTQTGWQRSYKTCDNISPLGPGKHEWSYDDNRDRGCAATAAGGEFKYNSKYNYLLTCSDSSTSMGAPYITITRRCPTTLTCTECPNHDNINHVISITDANGVDVSNGATGKPKICICDSGSDSNYENVCRTVQDILVDGKMAPDLCNFKQSQTMPNYIQCGTDPKYLWHCPGYNPPLSVDKDDIKYKNSLKGCFEATKSIFYDRSIAKEPSGGIAPPIYPTIDNDKCEVSGSNTSKAHSMPDPNISYYSLWNNPPANLVGNDIVYRTDYAGKSVYDKQKYNLVNATMVNGVPDPLPSLNGLDRSFNPGCFKDIKANPAKYCNGQGEFTQYCYTNGGALIGCDHHEAYYRVDDGYCSCAPGYTGNQCQYTNANICNGDGTVSSAQTGKSVHLSDTPYCSCKAGYTGNKCQYTNTNSCSGQGVASSLQTGKSAYLTDTPICSCNTYVSNADGVTKRYLGNQCEYSDIKDCNGHGTVNASGVCSCQNAWRGSNCATNNCGNGGSPNANGSACVGCQTAWADGNLCTTTVCKNRSQPNPDGNSCTCVGAG